jgi:hypothetical protein
VAIILCLGTPADIYLIDEPSAYLDSEQRIIAAKVIKRFILHAKKTAFVVEHDFIMATYLADRVIVYEGTPSVHAKANACVFFFFRFLFFLSGWPPAFSRRGLPDHTHFLLFYFFVFIADWQPAKPAYGHEQVPAVPGDHLPP